MKRQSFWKTPKKKKKEIKVASTKEVVFVPQPLEGSGDDFCSYCPTQVESKLPHVVSQRSVCPLSSLFSVEESVLGFCI